MARVTTDVEGWAEFVGVVDAEGAYPMYAIFAGESPCDATNDQTGVAFLGWLDDEQAREALSTQWGEVADRLEWLDDDADDDDYPVLDDVVTIHSIDRAWIKPLRGGGWEVSDLAGGDLAGPATLVEFAIL